MWKGDNVAAQQTAWLAVAASGPILSLIGRNAVGDVLVTALVCGILCFLVLRGTAKPGKWLSLFQIISTTVCLGSIAGKSASCWDHTADLPIIPWTLLVIAAFATGKGGDRARRAGSVLLWFVLPVIGITLLAGVGELNISAVRTMEGLPAWGLVPLFLLPCLHYFSADRETRIMGKGIWGLGILAVIATFWMDAVLGGQVAAHLENAFYEYSKGITIFGIAERFEALVGCALTVGWFGLFSYLLGITFASGERLGKDSGVPMVWICAASAGILMWKMHIPVEIAAVLSLISWVFLPVLTQIIDRVKNVNKPAKQP